MIRVNFVLIVSCVVKEMVKDKILSIEEDHE